MRTSAEQKFSDLTNRVEMLEMELIAMKLCKLKMEADKTSVEEHARQMEKTLATLQGTCADDTHAVRVGSSTHWSLAGSTLGLRSPTGLSCSRAARLISAMQGLQLFSDACPAGGG